MDSNGTDGKTPVYFENGGRTSEEVQKDLDSTNRVNHFVESERKSPNEQFCTESSNAMERERKNSSEVGGNALRWKSSAGLSDELDRHGTILSSGVENKTSDEQYEGCTTPKITNMVQHSSATDIPYSRDLSISPLIQAKRGLFFKKILKGSAQQVDSLLTYCVSVNSFCTLLDESCMEAMENLTITYHCEDFPSIVLYCLVFVVLMSMKLVVFTQT